MPEKISLRLGSLSPLIEAAATDAGVSVSEEIRRRVAESFGVAAPDMPQGFAAISEARADRLRKRSAATRKKASR